MGAELLNPHLDTLGEARRVGYRRIDGNPESTLWDALPVERTIKALIPGRVRL